MLKFGRWQSIRILFSRDAARGILLTLLKGTGKENF